MDVSSQQQQGQPAPKPHHHAMAIILTLFIISVVVVLIVKVVVPLLNPKDESTLEPVEVDVQASNVENGEEGSLWSSYWWILPLVFVVVVVLVLVGIRLLRRRKRGEFDGSESGIGPGEIPHDGSTNYDANERESEELNYVRKLRDEGVVFRNDGRELITENGFRKQGGRDMIPDPLEIARREYQEIERKLERDDAAEIKMDEKLKEKLEKELEEKFDTFAELFVHTMIDRNGFNEVHELEDYMKTRLDFLGKKKDDHPTFRKEYEELKKLELYLK